jgi:hypothetical protein
MFGKYNGFVSKARVYACMYFLVLYYNVLVGKKHTPSVFYNIYKLFLK